MTKQTNLTEVTATTFTGNLVGNVTGSITGDTTGQHTGVMKLPTQVLADDGAISIKRGIVILNKAGAIAATLADPTAATDDGKVLTVFSLTAQAHTVTIAGGLNGAGGGADVGTFGGAVGDQFSVFAYNGKWYKLTAAINVVFA